MHSIALFWAWALGAEVNRPKTRSFGGLNLGGVEDQQTAELLGETLRMHKEAKVPMPQKRWDEFARRLVRVGKLRGGRERRCRHATTAVH